MAARDGAARRGQPGASRCAVPRRVRRDRDRCPGGVANSAGGRQHPARPPRRCRVLPRPLPTRAGGQSVPVRTGRSEGLHLLVTATATVSGKLSGPLLDRVDLRVQMHTVRAGAFADESAESTADVRDRVGRARAAAAERWRPHGFTTNAEVTGGPAAQALSAERSGDGAAEGRPGTRPGQHPGVDRSTRVAWTLADLAGRHAESGRRHDRAQFPGRRGGRRMTDHEALRAWPTCPLWPNRRAGSWRRWLPPPARSRPRSGASRRGVTGVGRANRRPERTRHGYNRPRDVGSARWPARHTRRRRVAAAGVRVLRRCRPAGQTDRYRAVGAVGDPGRSASTRFITGPPRSSAPGGHRLRAARRR